MLETDAELSLLGEGKWEEERGFDQTQDDKKV